MIEKIKNLSNWTIGLIVAVIMAVISFVAWCLIPKK